MGIAVPSDGVLRVEVPRAKNMHRLMLATRSHENQKTRDAVLAAIERLELDTSHFTRERYVDLSGKRFGRLIVLKPFGKNKFGQMSWLCRCNCGNDTVVQRSSLVSGGTISCGCYARERASILHTKHGERHANATTPEYTAWQSMWNRCTLPYHEENKRNYQDRGITVFEEWKDFPTFLKYLLATIGRRPGPEYSIDRINNDKGYEPGNIRWATYKEQMRNRTNNRRITYHDETMTYAEFIERYRPPFLSASALRGRLSNGWEPELAISRPQRKRR